jgi:hypothetical protein
MQYIAELRLAESDVGDHYHAHTLRWLFRRGDDRLQCELGLTSDHCAYELRTNPRPDGMASASELFDDAFSAFRRHSTLERMLLDAGWTLEVFETGPARAR